MRRGVAAILLLAAASSGAGWTASAEEKPRAAEAAAPARSVDINAASTQELASIPGIGEALAARIVELREKEGPYRRVEDLLKVKGIGEKSFEKIRPYVRVGKPG